jgi:hypothetical protein
MASDVAKGAEHRSVLGGKTRSARVSSQWNQQLSPGPRSERRRLTTVKPDFPHAVGVGLFLVGDGPERHSSRYRVEGRSADRDADHELGEAAGAEVKRCQNQGTIHRRSCFLPCPARCLPPAARTARCFFATRLTAQACRFPPAPPDRHMWRVLRPAAPAPLRRYPSNAFVGRLRAAVGLCQAIASRPRSRLLASRDRAGSA